MKSGTEPCWSCWPRTTVFWMISGAVNASAARRGACPSSAKHASKQPTNVDRPMFIRTIIYQYPPNHAIQQKGDFGLGLCLPSLPFGQRKIRYEPRPVSDL